MLEHWSKEFVEHIRTVHFALIALCVGLMVLASFPSKTEVQIAHEQVSEILEVTNTWDSYFLRKAAMNTISPTSPVYRKVIDSPVPANFDFTMDGKEWLRPTYMPGSLEVIQKIPRELRSADMSSWVSPPKSLTSFQELWDELGEKGMVILPTPPDECYFTSWQEYEKYTPPRDTHFHKCEIQPTNSAHNAQDIPLYFHRAPWEREGGYVFPAGKWDFEFSTSDRFGVFDEPHFPVRKFERIQLDGRKGLIARSKKWTDKNGRSFSDAFRELVAVYQPFENADIGSAERILDAEARRTGDAFEAMGLKIPAELAVRFGVLFVLAVQLYLWIHLHEFGNRAEHSAGFEVAWIGVYVSKAARVVFLISVLALPICTVGLLTIRLLQATENRWAGWVVFFGGNLASFAISYCLYRALPQVLSSGAALPMTIESTDKGNSSADSAPHTPSFVEQDQLNSDKHGKPESTPMAESPANKGRKTSLTR